MLNKSDYLRNAIVNHNLRGVAFAVPAGRYLALFTGAPTSAGGGIEVTGSGYVRKPVVFSAPVTPGVTGNAFAIDQDPTGDWGPLISVGVFDALTGGNMLYFKDLATPKMIYAGDSFSFPVGYLTVSET